MKHRADDPALTARALGEASDVEPASFSTAQEDELEEIREVAGLLRDALRAEGDDRLDAAMRSRIAERAAGRGPRRTRLVSVLAVAACLFLLTAGLVMARLLRQREQTRVEQAALVQERARQIDAAEAQRAALERAVAERTAAEQAKSSQEARAAAALTDQPAALVRLPTPCDTPSGRQSDSAQALRQRSSSRPAAKPSKASKASSASGGCDPMDPLCGL